MSDEAPETTAAPVNPHAEIEAIASGAIALPVRVTERSEGIVQLVAPHHVTPHGALAIVFAVKAAFPDLSRVLVALDDPPASP